MNKKAALQKAEEVIIINNHLSGGIDNKEKPAPHEIERENLLPVNYEITDFILVLSKKFSSKRFLLISVHSFIAYLIELFHANSIYYLPRSRFSYCL